MGRTNSEVREHELLKSLLRFHCYHKLAPLSLVAIASRGYHGLGPILLAAAPLYSFSWLATGPLNYPDPPGRVSLLIFSLSNKDLAPPAHSSFAFGIMLSEPIYNSKSALEREGDSMEISGISYSASQVH